jgi:carboxy-cis,cis-muconate cyclase
VAGNYGAQSAVVSVKGTTLWATSRSRVAGKPGFISGFSLQEDGIILGQLFQVPTPTGGGTSNIVVSNPFSDNLMALTEAEKGSVSLWKYVNRTARVVASVNIGDSGAPVNGCCSDVVWLD